MRISLCLALIMAVCSGLMAAPVELSLTDGTTIQAEAVMNQGGAVTFRTGNRTFRVPGGDKGFTPESIAWLKKHPTTASIPFLGSTTVQPKGYQPTTYMDLKAAHEHGLIELGLLSNGTNVSLTVARTGLMPEMKLALSLSRAWLVRPKNGADVVYLLRREGQRLSAADGLKPGSAAVNVAYLVALERDKPVPETGDAFGLEEPEPLVSYLTAISSLTGPVGSLALIMHFNPGKTWEEWSKTAPAGYKPENWYSASNLLAYAQTRVAAYKSTIGERAAAFEGKWVPATAEEIEAAVEDVMAERRALRAIVNNQGTPAEIEAAKAKPEPDMKRELLGKFKPAEDPLYFYHDQHWCNLVPGLQPPVGIEGDPLGLTRVVTQGRWSWDGFQLRQERNQRGSGSLGGIDIGCVAANGVALLQAGDYGNFRGGFKRSGAAATVTAAMTKLVAPAVPVTLPPSKPAATAPTAAAFPVAPTVRREMSLLEAFQSGLLTVRVNGSEAELQRTPKAGFAPLNVVCYRAVAVTLEGGTGAEVFLPPGRKVAVPPSDPRRFSNVINLGAGALTAKLASKLEEADALTQFILASEHLRSQHRDLLLQVKSKGESAVLKRLRAASENLQQITGGNPEAWLAGNWVAATTTEAEKSFYELKDREIEEQMLANASQFTPERYDQQLTMSKEFVRQQWTLGVRGIQRSTSAVFTSEGGFANLPNIGQAQGVWWWWDGRYVRFDRKTEKQEAVEISPSGILCNDYLRPVIFLKKAGTP